MEEQYENQTDGIDVEKPAWEVYKYTDYINKLNRFQMHYFAVMN